MMARLYDVHYHLDYVPRLLHKLGWSPQKPIQRARERNATAIGRWNREDWSRIKKEPRQAS
jgi:putative transposase